MTTPVKLLLTGLGIFLIMSGGVDFLITTVPGIALIAYAWGLKL